MKARIQRLERKLPASEPDDGPLTSSDIKFLSDIQKVYGSGNEAPQDYAKIYKTRKALNDEFEKVIKDVYGDASR